MNECLQLRRHVQTANGHNWVIVLKKWVSGAEIGGG